MTVSAACVMTPSASFAANPSGESLIETNPLPGYSLAEGGNFDGAIDAGTLMELAGTDANAVPLVAHSWSGEARTWVNDAGGKAVIFVIDCDDAATATDFLSGAVRGSTNANDSTFDPGFAGSSGFTTMVDAVSLNVVIWRQGTYYIEAFVVGGTGTSEVKFLAGREAAFLESSTGDIPAARVTSRSSAEDSSIGYRVGQLIGTACLIGLVVFLIRNGKNRRAEREAGMAASQPEFYVRPPTPAATDNSAWARVPPPPPPR